MWARTGGANCAYCWDVCVFMKVVERTFVGSTSVTMENFTSIFETQDSQTTFSRGFQTTHCLAVWTYLAASSSDRTCRGFYAARPSVVSAARASLLTPSSSEASRPPTHLKAQKHLSGQTDTETHLTTQAS